MLFNKSYGIIILEVKGGGVFSRGRQWLTTNLSGTFEIRNPYEQAAEGAVNLYYELKKEFSEKGNFFFGNVKVYSGVCFPDIMKDSFNTKNSNIMNKTLFKSNLYDGSLEERILSIIDENKREKPGTYNATTPINDEGAIIIRDFFDYMVTSMISNEYTWLEASDKFIRLSNEQKKYWIT